METTEKKERYLKDYVELVGWGLFTFVTVSATMVIGAILGVAIERAGKWPISDPRK